MPGIAGKAPDAAALVLRLSVPAAGRLRTIAGELAAKVAEYLGTNAPDVDSVGEALEGLASTVAADAHAGDITFEFREANRELVIQARCNDRSSEVRYPLPA